MYLLCHIINIIVAHLNISFEGHFISSVQICTDRGIDIIMHYRFNYPDIHLSFYFFGAILWEQQPKQRNPHFPLPSRQLNVSWVSPVCPGSAPGPPSGGTYKAHLTQREVTSHSCNFPLRCELH